MNDPPTTGGIMRLVFAVAVALVVCTSANAARPSSGVYSIAVTAQTANTWPNMDGTVTLQAAATDTTGLSMHVHCAMARNPNAYDKTIALPAENWTENEDGTFTSDPQTFGGLPYLYQDAITQWAGVCTAALERGKKNTVVAAVGFLTYMTF